MKIEIKNENVEVVTSLLTKFLELNNNGDFNYLNNDSIFIGYNLNSGFSYIYLENAPHISLVMDTSKDLCLIYSSSLDGIEFIKYNLDNIKSLEDLEEELNKAYVLEEEIRDGDYNNETLTDKFCEVMYTNNWMDL